MPDTATPAISAHQLAERLAAGERLQVLDVREDASWGIEAEGLGRLLRSADAVLDDPAALAREVDGEVAVVCGRGLTARPVAAALRRHGVEARVLEGGMRAWIAELQAHPVELGMDGVGLRQVQRPGRGCLSYVLAAEGRALVVDPAADADFYRRAAADLGADVTDVVETHLHADHLSGARKLARAAGASLRLPAESLARGIAYADEVAPLHDGDLLAVGPLEVRAIALPGHTTDMTGLLVAGRALIGGDSLFADGIARPDLQRGDREGALAMARTLHSTLHGVLALGGDLLLLPGHTHPGVQPGPVAPKLAEVQAAVPELAVADPGEFAAEILASMPPRPANYESIIAANAGRGDPDPELENGPNSCATR